MYLKEFAEQRNVKPNTVAVYMKSHEKEFKGHTWLKNGRKWLDEDAIRLLEQKYPMPLPVQVIEDSEARKQLIVAQQLIIKLQQQLVEAAPAITLAEQNIKLIETMTEEKENLEKQNEELKNELQCFEKTIFGLYRKVK